ncbi:hypothetical protein M440DRAFT_22351 [Trichoderma longibrachiatum ATCC 18648]|uniref:Histone-fold-containing protein n=1 Tax=Trichoderma longibrachiatum ATCC 18648 TaxID=983965 RepID=A0A2T4BUD0_TRILO|nr:hypothetical protein M440DRAFT_22351 [Trichoderma longibrachiatum ATCC 18648]
MAEDSPYAPRSPDLSSFLSGSPTQAEHLQHGQAGYKLVTKSADVAKDKGSKRVTASMLKQVVEADEQWDFLRDIVGRVENEKEGSKAKAKDSETDEEMEEPKKRGRGGRRKKVQ